MKTISEIKNYMNFPDFYDIFGAKIEVGDVVGISTTGERRVNAYCVTNQMTNGNNLILVNILHESLKTYLNINELNGKTSKHWQALGIVKLTESLPNHLKEKALEIKNKYLNLKEERKEKAKAKLAIAIQTRYFPVFFYDKKSKKLGIIFQIVKSQPGKVIGNFDLKTVMKDLISKYPNYILNYIDSNTALCDIKEFHKPELHSLNKSYYGKVLGIKFNLNSIISFYPNPERNLLYSGELFEITKYKKPGIILKQYNRSIHHDMSVNKYNYFIENKNTYSDESHVDLKYVFSQDAMTKFEAFIKYYAA